MTQENIQKLAEVESLVRDHLRRVIEDKDIEYHLEKIIQVCFEAGKRAVVEWVEGHRSFLTLMSHMGREEWEDQKKKWGIK